MLRLVAALLVSWCLPLLGGSSEFKMDLSTSLTDPTPWTQGLEQILEKKFYLLGKQNDARKFISEDGNYVLIVFEKKTMQVPRWADFLPVGSWIRSLTPWHRKAERFYKRLCSNYAKTVEDDFVLYVHVGKGLPVDVRVRLVSGDFEETSVLSDAPFVLQRWADPYYKAMTTLIADGHVDQAKSLVDGMVAWVVAKDLQNLRLSRNINAVQLIDTMGVIEGRVVTSAWWQFSTTIHGGDLAFPTLKELLLQLRGLDPELDTYGNAVVVQALTDLESARMLDKHPTALADAKKDQELNETNT